MKTLAEFKRLCATPDTVFTAYFPDKDKTARRIPNHVQSNAVTFKIDPDKPADAKNRNWIHLDNPDQRRFTDGVLVIQSTGDDGVTPLPLVAYAVGEVFPEPVRAALKAEYEAAEKALIEQREKRRKEIEEQRAAWLAAEPKPIPHNHSDDAIRAAIRKFNADPAFPYKYMEQMKTEVAKLLGQPELATDREFGYHVYSLNSDMRRDDEKAAADAKAKELEQLGYIRWESKWASENVGKKAIMWRTDKEQIKGRIASDGRGGFLFLPSRNTRSGFLPKYIKLVEV